MSNKTENNKMELRFKRDAKLGHPGHTSANQPEARKEYIDRLIKNADFRPTYIQNDARFEESAREIFSHLRKFDIFVIVAMMAILGSIGGACKYSTYNPKTTTAKKVLGSTPYALFGILAGLLFGCVTTVANKRSDRESGVESFYNRMIVRLFDVLHKTYPDLDENVLRNCNPEMARVIQAIMIANMSESDTRTIHNIAMKLYDTTYPNTLTEKEMQDIEKGIKQASIIVLNTLSEHPELNDMVIDAYRGKIPAKFVLPQQAKTR